MNKDLFVEKHSIGLNDLQLAEAFNISIPMVKYWRKSLSLPVNSRPAITEEELAKRLDLYAKGYSDAEISRACGVNPSTICLWRKSRCLKANNPQMFRGGRKHSLMVDLEEMVGSDVSKFLEV